MTHLLPDPIILSNLFFFVGFALVVAALAYQNASIGIAGIFLLFVSYQIIENYS